MRLPVEFVSSIRPKYEGRTVCVTGGAGFIGGHLVDALLSLGATIQVIDDLSTSSLDHLAELIDLDPQRVRFTHGSILDSSATGQAVEGAEVVFHLAAVGSVPLSMKEPRRTFAVNSTGTVAVLEAARAVGVKRVVFASSSSVYGTGEPALPGGGGPAADAPRVETMPLCPISPYGASKLAAEGAVRAWSAAYGIQTVCLRYFNVFGPRQDPDSPYAAVIPAFIKRCLNGESPVIFGDGRHARDYTYIANVVAANLLAGVCDHAAVIRGSPVNIAAGVRTDLLELARLVGERCGTVATPEFRPERPGDIRVSSADIGLARRALGYQPVASLADGLTETVQWYRRALAGI